MLDLQAAACTDQVLPEHLSCADPARWQHDDAGPEQACQRPADRHQCLGGEPPLPLWGRALERGKPPVCLRARCSVLEACALFTSCKLQCLHAALSCLMAAHLACAVADVVNSNQAAWEPPPHCTLSAAWGKPPLMSLQAAMRSGCEHSNGAVPCTSVAAWIYGTCRMHALHARTCLCGCSTAPTKQSNPELQRCAASARGAPTL